MKIAIVGFGKMGKLYDSLLGASYIVDQNPVQKRIYFSSVDEFVYYHQPVDLVIVATSTNSHFKVAKQLLLSGYNVLVEKPICLSSDEAMELEKIAARKKLILYQSTLERYNPMIIFLRQNIKMAEISKIVSYRFGDKPARQYIEETKFDLGIHDVDLSFHLFNKKIPWEVKTGYGKKKREIQVFLKNSKMIKLDLLRKKITIDNHVIKFSEDSGNPIGEMIKDIMEKGNKMNEKWSEEIAVIERAKGNSITVR